jgi:hypothetical protein
MTDAGHAFDGLKAEMNADPEYAWAWLCNLAMPVMDSYEPYMRGQSFSAAHEAANQAGAHLMQHLFGIDITKDDRFVAKKSGAQNYAEFRIAMDADEDAEIAAQAISTGTVETAKLAQGEACERGPEDAPDPSRPTHPDNTVSPKGCAQTEEPS